MFLVHLNWNIKIILSVLSLALVFVFLIHLWATRYREPRIPSFIFCCSHLTPDYILRRCDVILILSVNILFISVVEASICSHCKRVKPLLFSCHYRITYIKAPIAASCVQVRVHTVVNSHVYETYRPKEIAVLFAVLYNYVQLKWRVFLPVVVFRMLVCKY